MRLALDHLTLADSDPLQLVAAARDSGCEGVCLFLESMDVLSAMPPFSLARDAGLRRDLGRALADGGMAFDLAYPFTLSARTRPSALAASLHCAATLGARAVNLLVYDREPARRLEGVARFVELAASYGLVVALEFYPPSAVPTLAVALAVVDAVGRPGQIGVNVDLLHLMRSGGTIKDVEAAPIGAIAYAQICDGPAARASDELSFEASSDRLLPGTGTFDVRGFVDALPATCPISIEAPRTSTIARLPRTRRASRAMHATLKALRRF